MTGTARADRTQEEHRLPVRTLVSASIGNAVEWFDWTV
jgi:MHS family alpha-ketoglutarate permease-like MFS transporter